jgi:hypothetical protein
MKLYTVEQILAMKPEDLQKQYQDILESVDQRLVTLDLPKKIEELSSERLLAEVSRTSGVARPTLYLIKNLVNHEFLSLIDIDTKFKLLRHFDKE